MTATVNGSKKYTKKELVKLLDEIIVDIIFKNEGISYDELFKRVNIEWTKRGLPSI